MTLHIAGEMRIELEGLVRIHRVHDERISVYCPFHKQGAERRASMSIYLESGRVICFACGYKQSLARFLRDLGVEREYAESWARTFRALTPLPVPRKNKEEFSLMESHLGVFQRSKPQVLLEAGFTEWILDRYEIGWDQSRSRVIYPIRDEHGKLVALVGGSATDYPKYEAYPESESGYRQHLWGIHLLPAGVPYVVVEGYKACLWVAQAGYPVVATQGVGFTTAQVNTMVRRYAPVHIMFDQDDAGISAARRLYERLLKEMGPRVRIVPYPRREALQPDWLTVEEIAEALSPPSLRHEAATERSIS